MKSNDTYARLTNAVVRRIEELKKEKRMTQAELSVMSGIPQTTLISIKRKRSKSVGAYTIYLLCEGFGISLREFYDSPLFDRAIWK